MFQKIKIIYLSILSILIGMKVTLKNLFAKRVTLNYPSEKQPMKKNFRGMVDLIPEACVICYQCIKICPTAALDLAHKTVTAEEKKKNEITKFTFNAELCCFCGLCEEICPTDAIFLNKMYEVSAFSHDQMIDIDLMKSGKYTHLDSSYDFKKEAEKMAKPAKPAAAPVKPAVATPSDQAATATAVSDTPQEQDKNQNPAEPGAPKT